MRLRFAFDCGVVGFWLVLLHAGGCLRWEGTRASNKELAVVGDDPGLDKTHCLDFSQTPLSQYQTKPIVSDHV